jgi:hypothetical protein
VRSGWSGNYIHFFLNSKSLRHFDRPERKIGSKGALQSDLITKEFCTRDSDVILPVAKL